MASAVTLRWPLAPPITRVVGTAAIVKSLERICAAWTPASSPAARHAPLRRTAHPLAARHPAVRGLLSGRPVCGRGAMARRRGRAGVRDGWRGQWQRGQLHQQQHVVIGGRAVHPQPPAAGAAVNQHPPAFAADGDRDRLHAARAVSLPVTGDVAVKVPGPQAAGTVVAVRRAGGVQGDVYAAMSALKRVRKRQVWRPSFRAGPRSWTDISPPLAHHLVMPLARAGPATTTIVGSGESSVKQISRSQGRGRRSPGGSERSRQPTTARARRAAPRSYRTGRYAHHQPRSRPNLQPPRVGDPRATPVVAWPVWSLTVASVGAARSVLRSRWAARNSQPSDCGPALAGP
jgi:hypothetical protein